MTDKPIKIFCPECGPSDTCDSDGCCLQCGATATGKELDDLLAYRDQLRDENEQLRKDLAYQKHLAERKADRDKIAIDNENLREVIRTLTDRLDSANKHANALNMDNTALRNKLGLLQQENTMLSVRPSMVVSRRDLYVLAVTIGVLAGNSDAELKDYLIDADNLMAVVDGVK
jgi:predicted RNase H-like nuclease (RuvC/YqgF family)